MENQLLQATINNVMKPSNEAAVNKLINGAPSSNEQQHDTNNNSTAAFEIRGFDLNAGVDYHNMFKTYANTGFQATNLSRAMNEIERMISCKLSEMPEDKQDSSVPTNCTIFLGYTSNMISCGMREYIRYLVQHKMVDCLVCTAGGIEEDFIKCLAPTLSGDFNLSGEKLRVEGINRIGNLLIPNDNYCKFEDWIMPIFDKLVDEQKSEGTSWTPSKIINRLGKEINHPDSVYYWAYKVFIILKCLFMLFFFFSFYSFCTF
jgi:deoxyhypusine synthase